MPLQNAALRASGLRRTPQERNPRPMISQGTPGPEMLTGILLGSISSSPKLYPNQSRTRVARPMVSQGTQRLAAMGNSQTVLACHCIARLFLGICFLILGAQKLDPASATFPAADESVLLSCFLCTRPQLDSRTVCVCVSVTGGEKCLCAAHSIASGVFRLMSQNTVSTESTQVCGLQRAWLQHSSLGPRR